VVIDRSSHISLAFTMPTKGLLLAYTVSRNGPQSARSSQSHSTTERRQSEKFQPYGTQPQSYDAEAGYSISQSVWPVVAEELRG